MRTDRMTMRLVTFCGYLRLQNKYISEGREAGDHFPVPEVQPLRAAKGTSWQPCHVCYFYEASSPVLQLLPVVVVQPRSLPLHVACVPFQ